MTLQVCRAAKLTSDPSDRAVQGVGLQPLTCWDCGFEFRRGHGFLSVVIVACCDVEVSASGRSLVWRSPTECGLSVCDIETFINEEAHEGCRIVTRNTGL